MPRIKIKMSEAEMSFEVDVDDESETFDSLTVKALKLVAGLDVWMSKKPTNEPTR